METVPKETMRIFLKDDAQRKLAADAMQEARIACVVYQYFARILLDHIDVPGTEALYTIYAQTTALLGDHAECSENELSTWCDRIEGLLEQESAAHELLAKEQQALAIDRTRLLRGTNPAGPLPPYESYYRVGDVSDDNNLASPAAESAKTSVSAAYEKASIETSGLSNERDDFLGVEFAFLAYLAEQEINAWENADEVSAVSMHSQREAFEREHVGAWIGLYCAAAAPHAQTDFFKGFMHIMAEFAV